MQAKKYTLAVVAVGLILTGCGKTDNSNPDNAGSRIAKACAQSVKRKGLPTSSYDSCLQITRGMLEEGITEEQILTRLDGKAD